DRDPHWLVHGRGRPSTLDGLCRSADSRRHDTVTGSRCGSVVTHRLWSGVHLHLRLRDLLHLQATARGPDRAPDPASRRRNSEPAQVGCRRTPSRLGHTSRYGDTSSRRRRIAMVMFWVAVLATSILLYVLLDGFDLGVGILFGLTPDEARRRVMLSTVAPIW